MAPRVLIPMADYGHDPTEVAVPFKVFQDAGFEIDFATEKGQPAKCDTKMLEGATGALLGADAAAKKAHNTILSQSPRFQKPLSWLDASFTLDAYDLIFLPGGHERGVRQVIDSEPLHKALQLFFPLTARTSTGEGGDNNNNKKVVAAICHGVQILAFTPAASSPAQKFPITEKGHINPAQEFRSVIHACKTTALPGFMEGGIFQTTRLFLGSYYKTYGSGTPNVEDYVRYGLDKPDEQFFTGPGLLTGKMGKPFTVEDDQYRYVSGRFPPDAEAVAKRAVELVKEVAAS